MYKVELNNKFFDVDFFDKNSGEINNEQFNLDILNTKENSFHVLHKNKSFEISLKSVDRIEKTLTLTVNNNTYNIKIKNELDELLKSLGIDNIAKKVIKELKAPMPGLVIGILVSEGQNVSEGDTLLVLEAMKMENNLKSPINGTIKNIKTKKGNAVEKNEILITFE